MERFVEVAEGVSLWVESRGPEDAPAILLIMGSTVSGLVWPDELVEALARKHRVIRYDHRDTGASTWAFDRVPYSATRMAEDALAILDALGIERAHVVGLSLGGFLVQWLLVAHPERLLSATVIGAPALEGAPARANLTARAPIDPGLCHRAHARHRHPGGSHQSRVQFAVPGGDPAALDPGDDRRDGARDSTCRRAPARGGAPEPHRHRGRREVVSPQRGRAPRGLLPIYRFRRPLVCNTSSIARHFSSAAPVGMFERQITVRR